LIDFAHFNELNLIAKKVTPPPNLQKKNTISYFWTLQVKFILLSSHFAKL